MDSGRKMIATLSDYATNGSEITVVLRTVNDNSNRQILKEVMNSGGICYLDPVSEHIHFDPDEALKTPIEKRGVWTGKSAFDLK